MAISKINQIEIASIIATENFTKFSVLRTKDIVLSIII